MVSLLSLRSLTNYILSLDKMIRMCFLIGWGRANSSCDWRTWVGLCSQAVQREVGIASVFHHPDTAQTWVCENTVTLTWFVDEKYKCSGWHRRAPCLQLRKTLLLTLCFSKTFGWSITKLITTQCQRSQFFAVHTFLARPSSPFCSCYDWTNWMNRASHLRQFVWVFAKHNRYQPLCKPALIWVECQQRGLRVTHSPCTMFIPFDKITNKTCG